MAKKTPHVDESIETVKCYRIKETGVVCNTIEGARYAVASMYARQSLVDCGLRDPDDVIDWMLSHAQEVRDLLEQARHAADVHEL